MVPKLTSVFCMSFSALLILAVGVGYNVLPAEAGGQLGIEIPAEEPVIELGNVLDNPSAYSGRTIVMKGTVSGQCAALCEFFFQDGLHTATIYPQGFKFPRLERGKAVTIYTQVISGPEKVVFSAVGLKMD